MSGRLVSPTIVGRDRELRQVESALIAALAGQPQHLVVAGEAGVGKTRLVTELGEMATMHGMRVLRGSCANIGEGGLPYGPFVEAFRSLAGDLPPDMLEAVVGPDGPDLARLVPGLAPMLPMHGAIRGEWAQARMLQAILGVVQRLAEHAPLLFVLEDLHWADPATRDTVAYLVRSLRSERVVSALTVRSDELHRRHPMRPWLAELERTGLAQRIDLERLDAIDTLALAAAILGDAPDPAQVERIHRRSDGNPFFVEELLAADGGSPTGPMPPTLREILLTRLEALPDTAQPVLGAIAVAGRSVDHEMLLAVTQLSEPDLEAALRTAVEHQVLVADAGYRFRHALLHEAAYDDLLPGERQRLHRAFAFALAGRSVGDGAEAAGYWAELAHHWTAARDDGRAFEAFVRAGQTAAHAYAFADARRHDEHALDLWPSVDEPERRAGLGRTTLLDHAARAAWLGGDPRRAVAWYREAVAAMPDDADPIERGVRLERLARALWTDGHSLEAMDACEAAIAIMPATPPTAEGARVLSGYGQLLMLMDQPDAAIQHCNAAIEMARAVGARQAEGHALNSLGLSLAMAGRCTEGTTALEAALDIARAMADPDDIGRAFVNMSEARSYCGDTAGAMTVVREGIAETERLGMRETYGYYLAQNGIDIAFEFGDPVRATALNETTRRMDEVGRQQYRYGLAQSIQFLVATGDPTGTERLEELRARVVGFPVEAQFSGPYRVAAAERALWADDPEAALEAALTGLDELAAIAWLRYPVRLVRLAARAVADLAEIARARRDAAAMDSAMAEAERTRGHVRSMRDRLPPTMAGAPLDEIEAELATAEAELGRAAGTEAAAEWAGVASRWEVRARPYLVAYARWREAEAHMRAGDRPAAGAALSEASRLARRVGARPLQAAVDGLAARARLAIEGALVETMINEPPAPATSVSDADRLGLTPREREVLVLVARGWTNRQIADALFISTNTAGVHVSNILGKLDAATRTEAATIAARLGLDEG